MNPLNNLYGAETKNKFIETLTTERERREALRCFEAFSYSEDMHDCHLFEMNADMLVNTIHLSTITPATSSTAQAIKTFLIKYHKWAQNNGLVSSPNPLAKIHAIDFCTKWAVKAKYVSSIEALQERLLNVQTFSPENGKWSMLFLGLLLVFDGLDHTKLGELKYEDVNFENKTIAFHGEVKSLSDVTLNYIREIHQWRNITLPITVTFKNFKIEDNQYVIPRVPYGLKKFEGMYFSKTLSQFKSRNEILSDDDSEWCSAESVQQAGKFYRVYTGAADNKFDSQEQYIYEFWLDAHYPC